MVIITDANGNIQSPTIPDNVYQGSNLANEIVFLAPLPQTNVATITFRLPNGVLIEEQTMTPYNDVPGNYSAWRFVLNDEVTQYYGQVTFQIYIYGASGNIWYLNAEPKVDVSFSESANFKSNGQNFSSMSADGTDLYYGSTKVYDGLTSNWTDLAYRRVSFNQSFSNNTDALLVWLKANGEEEAPTLITSVAGTFPVLRGVPRIPHSLPSQASWQQICTWVSTINASLAQLQNIVDNNWLESKGILPYDSSFTYSQGASVFDKNTKTIYTSLQPDNYNHSLSDTSWWGKTVVTGTSPAEVEALIEEHNTSNTAHNDIRNLIAGKQDQLSPTQLDAVNSGITADKIMNSPATTSENPLVNRDFVNSSIATNTANFIGTFEKVELLQNVGYLVIYSVLKEDSVIAKGSVVNGTTYTHDTTLNSDLNITADSTLAFGSIIKSGSTIEIGSIINHEEYDSQTTTSADIEVETITNNDYANVINQVIDFIDLAHLNAYDKDLLTNYDYGWIPNGAKYDLYRFDIATQTWESRATNINKTDVSLITAYNRYTYNGSTEEWVWNYTVNTSGFTASQWSAINSGATAEQITKIGTDALTTTAQTLSSAVNELKSGKQDKNLVFTNTAVAQADWQSDNTYTGYGYKATLTLTGVTADMIPQVVYGADEAVSGNYLPVAESYAGGIYIYSKVDDAITIPTIILQKAGA